MARRRRRAQDQPEIGDLGCPGVDVYEWMQQNRAPMFPGKTNRWVLLRSLNDGADDETVRTTCQAVLAKWFEDVAAWDPIGEAAGMVRVGPADNLDIKRVAGERIGLDPRAARREDVGYPPVPMLASGPWTSVELEFDWRSHVEWIPWPVWHGGMAALKATRRCPTDADWILDQVGMPLKESPPELSQTEKAGKVLEEAGEAAKEAAEDVVKWIVAPIALLGGLGLAAYFAAKRKLRS